MDFIKKNFVIKIKKLIVFQKILLFTNNFEIRFRDEDNDLLYITIIMITTIFPRHLLLITRNSRHARITNNMNFGNLLSTRFR